MKSYTCFTKDGQKLAEPHNTPEKAWERKDVIVEEDGVTDVFVDERLPAGYAVRK